MSAGVKGERGPLTARASLRTVRRMITEPQSTPKRPPRSTRRRPAASSRLVVLALLGVGSTLAMACQPAGVPWAPSSEDTGPDSGPDPGTCEYRRDCGRLAR
jgi:hypothetical protein